MLPGLQLGAKPVEDREGVADLLDNRVSRESGYRQRSVAHRSPSIWLATHLSPSRSHSEPFGAVAPPDTLRRFSVEVFARWQRISDCVRSRIECCASEQPFLFAQPQSASFVRLHLVDSHKLELQNQIGLGEFKDCRQR